MDKTVSLNSTLPGLFDLLIVSIIKWGFTIFHTWRGYNMFAEEPQVWVDTRQAVDK